MNMWNWLLDCYKRDCLTLEELENVMINDYCAERLWTEWTIEPKDYIDFVRCEIKPFIEYIKKIER